MILGDKVDLRAYTACLQEVLVGGLSCEGALKGASILTEGNQ